MIFSCEMLDFDAMKCDLFCAYDFENREAVFLGHINSVTAFFFRSEM